LGFTFGRLVSRRTGKAYLGLAPAGKKVQAICTTISVETGSQTTWQSIEEKVAQLNQILMGWGNYFRLGYVTGAWAVVQQHACRRLRRWLRRKHGQAGGVSGYPILQLYEEYGLVELIRVIRRIPPRARA
jgi:RNA-directed DNA polymerase